MEKLFCWIVVCLPILSWATDEQIEIGRFSKSDLKGWQAKIFAGETEYSLKTDGHQTALHANSNATASGLYHEFSIDLAKTPILNWTWKVDNILTDNDERTRGGDDYPARIYVVFSSELAFWRTRAINYVWSNRQPINSSWFSAFTGNAGMIAVESGVDRIGQWVSESRDVLADYRRLFGEEPGRVNAVAIMTDTDNTSAVAKAWYGDIWFADK